MPSRRKKSLQSYCSVDFDFLAFMRLDMTFDITLRDDSSFGRLTNTSHRLIFKKNTCGNPCIYLRFPGSLKPSCSICYIVFSSEEKYFGALLLFHKIPLKHN